MHGFANTRLGTGHWNETGHRVAGELAAATCWNSAEDGMNGMNEMSGAVSPLNRRTAEYMISERRSEKQTAHHAGGPVANHGGGPGSARNRMDLAPSVA